LIHTAGDLLLPSPPAEKATASQDEAGKSSTGNGARDTTGDRRIVVSFKAAIAAQDKLSDGLTRTGMDVEIIRNCRAARRGETRVANE